MTDTTLFADTDTAAELDGYGPIPAELARAIIGRATEPTTTTGGGDTGTGDSGTGDSGTSGAGTAVVAKAAAWIRRLYSDPVTGMVTQVDSRRRRFTGALAAYLVYRDRYCRTSYCEAPIRHLDHIRAHADGGPTSAGNGRGLCERCNYINQLPGWAARVIDADRHIVETTTPTGHTYRSHPPPVPGHPRPAVLDDQASDHPRRSHPPPPAA